MVFGALLGGLVNRAGERSYGELQRSREIEDFQRQQRINFGVDFLNKHYEDLTPDQQIAVHQNLAKDLGVKPQDFEAYVGGARAIHKILPAVSSAVPFSGTQTVTPSPTIPLDPTQAIGPSPAPLPPVQMSPLPASVYSQMPSHTATGPSMTPGEVKRERLFNENQRLIDMKVARLKGMQLPPDIEQIAALQAQGVNIQPYEAAMLRAQSASEATQQKRDAMAMRMTEAYGNPNVVKRGDQNIWIWNTKSGQPVEVAPDGSGTRPFVPQPGDTPATPGQFMPYAGAKEAFSFNKQTGRFEEAPGVGVQPKGQAPQSQLTTIEDATGPRVAAYIPERGGGPGKIVDIQQGAAKGRLPNIPGKTKDQIEGLGMAAQSLGNIQQMIPQIKTGPVWGALRGVQFKYLGGWGTTPEEVQVAQSINELMLQSFDIAGANFTENEMSIFRSLYPKDSDTMDTVMTKIPGMLRYIQLKMKTKQGLLTPGQKIGVTMPDVGAGGQPPKDMSGYGPRQQFRHNGQVKWGRRNLSTGKIMLEK